MNGEDMDEDGMIREAEVQREMNALSRLAATEDGEMFLARLFYQANVLERIHRTSAEVYRLAGVQAFALQYWNEIWRANPAASTRIYQRLMRMNTDAILEEENNA